MRNYILFFGLGLAAVAGCVHGHKKNTDISENESIKRGVASREAPEGYEIRWDYKGTFQDLVDALKLMRGNLEREKVLEISTRRDEMLAGNLYDTGVTPNGYDDNGVRQPEELNCSQQVPMIDGYTLYHRTADGNCYMYNQGANFNKKPEEADLSILSKMGNNRARFGRNTSPQSPKQQKFHDDNLLHPNPIEVSKLFFSRIPNSSKPAGPDNTGFQPVPWVNLLATAWLQAENHDWFTHGKNVTSEHLPKDPRWQRYAQLFAPVKIDYRDGSDLFSFIIPRTLPDYSALIGKFPGQEYKADGSHTSLESGADSYGRKYRNQVTHWWDASHIYGSDAETIKRVRTIPEGVTGVVDSNNKALSPGEMYPDGKIAVDEVNRKLYYREDPKNDQEVLPITGFNDNWWVGLEMIHTVFALEHNKVAARLKKDLDSNIDKKEQPYTYWKRITTDAATKPTEKESLRSDFLFEKSRMIVAALIAKIHTVEWTPAILDNPGLRMGMHANWYGAKSVVQNVPLVNRLSGKRIMSKSTQLVYNGLTGPGSLNLYNVPFTLTEEFVSVYRMHSLLADKVDLYKVGNSERSTYRMINDARDGDVATSLTAHDMNSTDWMFSFGRNYAGLMTLHNYPQFMEDMEVRRNTRNQKKDHPIKMNMGAVDVFRDRERHVPRYNEFRRQFNIPGGPIERFEELFITSKILYTPPAQPGTEQVIEKLRRVIGEKYDVPLIERDIDKIEKFSIPTVVKNFAAGGKENTNNSNGLVGIAKSFFSGGKEGVITDGKKLIGERVFYNEYLFNDNIITPAERALLFTDQEKIDIANMKRIYVNRDTGEPDVELLDLLVGTLAEEDRFDMFGFGNSPFYLFALMASRRLMTDPFLSDLFVPEYYTQMGVDWVNNQSMVDVLARNYPELLSTPCDQSMPNADCTYDGHFTGVVNAFHPWKPTK